MKKFVLMAVMVCALAASFILAGCSAQQVSDEVISAQVALAPLKAQIATLPNGAAKTQMQKTLARLEKGAADAAGWAAAVSELEAYFADLIGRLKTMKPAAPAPGTEPAVTPANGGAAKQAAAVGGWGLGEPPN